MTNSDIINLLWQKENFLSKSLPIFNEKLLYSLFLSYNILNGQFPYDDRSF